METTPHASLVESLSSANKRKRKNPSPEKVSYFKLSLRIIKYAKVASSNLHCLYTLRRYMIL